MIHFPDLHNEDNMTERRINVEDNSKPFNLLNVNAFKESVQRAQVAHRYNQVNTILKRVNDELQKVSERNQTQLSYPPSGHVCIAALHNEHAHFEAAAEECKKQGYSARVEEQGDNMYLVVYISVE